MLPDLTLCSAAVTYVLAQYRLVGLTAGVFPPLPRKSATPPPRAGSAGIRKWVRRWLRSPRRRSEAISLGSGGRMPAPWRIQQEHWQLGLVAWLVLGGLGHRGGGARSPGLAAVVAGRGGDVLAGRPLARDARRAAADQPLAGVGHPAPIMISRDAKALRSASNWRGPKICVTVGANLPVGRWCCSAW